MSRFLQLHALTSYPPANLNRDDAGRPKTAVFGGSTRLRISSQCLKRAWRTSEIFAAAMPEHLGIRTKELGRKIHEALVTGRNVSDLLEKLESSPASPAVSADVAKSIAQKIAGTFGALKKPTTKDPDLDLEIEQLAHFAPEEIAAVDALLDALRNGGGREPTDDELVLFRQLPGAVDVAMFGRMIADAPRFGVEGAVEVGHALSVHRVSVEDDYFSAVDDLNEGIEDVGAGHIGVNEFAAGLFYHYVCVDLALLRENLRGNAGLAATAVKALTECVLTVGPSGKRNSYGSRAYASYLLAEKGDQQPRNLSVAFLKALSGPDMLSDAIQAIDGTCQRMDDVYDACADARYVLNAVAGQGSRAELLAFVAG